MRGHWNKRNQFPDDHIFANFSMWIYFVLSMYGSL